MTTNGVLINIVFVFISVCVFSVFVCECVCEWLSEGEKGDREGER